MVAVLKDCMMFLLILCWHKSKSYPSQSPSVTLEGNQTLIALLPSLIDGSGKVNPQALLWMELIKFMVKETNKNNVIHGRLMGNFTLGYIILDTCNSFDVVGKQLLDMLLDDELFMVRSIISEKSKTCKIENYDGDPLCTKTARKTLNSVAGLLSGVQSNITDSIVPLLKGLGPTNGRSGFHMISFQGSESDGSNDILFTSIQNQYFASATVELVQNLNWTYIGVVHTTDYISINRMHRTVEALNSAGVCFAYIVPLTGCIHNIRVDPYAQGILVFAESFAATTLLSQVAAENITAKTWIFGSPLNQSAIESLCIRLKGHIVFEVSPWTGRFRLFERYFWSLNSSMAGNPWLATFFHYMNSSSDEFRTLGDYRAQFFLDDLGFLYNAVQSYINAGVYLSKLSGLQKLLYLVSMMHSASSPNLGDAINRSKFTSLLGNKLRYNSFGRTSENILRIRVLGLFRSHCKFQYLGQWNANLSLSNCDKKKLSDVHISSCDSECEAGYELQHYLDNQCCLVCVLCPVGFVKNTTGSQPCHQCPTDSVASDDHTYCIHYERVYFRYNTSAGIFILLLSFVSIFVATSVAVTFFMYRQTPVVRASGIIMVTTQLVTHILLSLSVIMYFGEPSNGICLARFLTLFSLLTSSVAVLLIKTERLLYIFAASRKLTRKSVVKTVTIEYSTMAFLVLFSVTVSLIHSALNPILTASEKHLETMTEDVFCNYSQHYLVQVAYISILCSICFIQAFRARRLPENFNETKFVMLGSFLWLVVLFASVPMQVSVHDGEKIVAIECVVTFLCNICMLLSLFGYKVWIIYFQPDMNTREYFQRQSFAAAAKSASRNMLQGSFTSSIKSLEG